MRNFLKAGCLHPVTQFCYQVTDILISLGYNFVNSPEIETVENNFDLLNIPFDHPSRSKQDTFYLNSGLILRTHTSNTQVRILKKLPNKELKIMTVGKVYRRDEDDFTHVHQFTQIEGFVVGKKTSLLQLRETISFLIRHLLGDVSYRFRPSFFPFTTCSFECDIHCPNCQDGCQVCKQTGWLEMLGAGLINPQVLKNCGFKKDFSGFAFGIGVERFLMVYYGLNDIRDFFSNDLLFLRQFNSLF